ncbi:hypothetical protein ACFVH0_32245 [Streptomyces sp. NPDC127117]|uniref:hypothetical protein n=1 Tax=Streptomyces sp. NPDC127117 TaxID=3345368 RepID=UPI003632EDE6
MTVLEAVEQHAHEAVEEVPLCRDVTVAECSSDIPYVPVPGRPAFVFLPGWVGGGTPVTGDAASTQKPGLLDGDVLDRTDTESAPLSGGFAAPATAVAGSRAPAFVLERA